MTLFTIFAIFKALIIDTIEFTIAALSGWLVLWILDRRTGARFQVAYEEIRANGQLHWYYSARFIGICLLAAAVYGK